MSNVIRTTSTGGGSGNNVIYGNTVRASTAMIAYNSCCQVTDSLGQSVVDVNTLVESGDVKTVMTSNSPVVVLSASLSTSETNLALGVPNLAGVGSDCPIVCITVINSSGTVQELDSDPLLSNVKRTDVANILEPDCAYTLYYDPSAAAWYPTCDLSSP